MTELLLCLVFIPIIFLTPKKTAGIGAWLPALLGAICVGYFVWLRREEPLLWGGVAAFLAMTLSETFEKKSLQPFTALSALFFAQSLLGQNLSVIIICIVFGDLFINVEIFSKADLLEKTRAIQNISRSLFAMLPVTFGVLLGFQGHLLIFMVAASVILRLFSWPFPHWISEENEGTSYFSLLVGVISSFALWHGQSFLGFPEWPMIWMIITALLSLGARSTEVYISVALGLFSVSPNYGLLFTAIWPLLVCRGKSLYLVALFTALAGGIICEAASKTLIENAVYILGGISALFLARPFVTPGVVGRPWINEAGDILLSMILFGVFTFFLPIQVPIIGPAGATFVGAFILSYVVGKIFYSKHPKLFSPMKGIKVPLVPDLSSSASSFYEMAGPQIDLSENPTAIKFYRALESESHLIWLLGILGAALYWGAR
jgi:hypothetical protein